MKVGYYSVKVFGYGLYLLYCFRVTSLTVEEGRNLFTFIARKMRCRLLYISMGRVRHIERILQA